MILTISVSVVTVFPADPAADLLLDTLLIHNFKALVGSDCHTSAVTAIFNQQYLLLSSSCHYRQNHHCPVLIL